VLRSICAWDYGLALDRKMSQIGAGLGPRLQYRAMLRDSRKQEHIGMRLYLNSVLTTLPSSGYVSSLAMGMAFAAAAIGCGDDASHDNSDFPKKCKNYIEVTCANQVRCGISVSKEACMQNFKNAFCDPIDDIERLQAGRDYDACITELKTGKCTAGLPDQCDRLWEAR